MRNVTPDNESKTEKFRRLANSRVNNAIKDMDLICNLANKSNYDYTQEDVDKILRALKAAYTEVEKAFSKNKKKTRFEL